MRKVCDRSFEMTAIVLLISLNSILATVAVFCNFFAFVQMSRKLILSLSMNSKFLLCNILLISIFFGCTSFFSYIYEFSSLTNSKNFFNPNEIESIVCEINGFMAALAPIGQSMMLFWISAERVYATIKFQNYSESSRKFSIACTVTYWFLFIIGWIIKFDSLAPGKCFRQMYNIRPSHNSTVQETNNFQWIFGIVVAIGIFEASILLGFADCRNLKISFTVLKDFPSCLGIIYSNQRKKLTAVFTLSKFAETLIFCLILK